MKLSHVLKFSVKPLLAVAALGFNLMADAALPWPNAPFEATQSATPITMLLTGKDHRMFYEAYNDTSDIDGDGTLDIRFKPYIRYYGLFDSDVCYEYNTSSYTYVPKSYGTSPSTTEVKISTKDADGNVTTKTVAKANYGHCPGKFSGNWMNWVTTSRMDALRKVLYGGKRSTDTTTKTVLRRAYIPSDAHTWAKEYTSEATDGYKISDYTPFSKPAENTRHFFGNLTDNIGVNCSTLSDCSDKLAPLMRARLNVPSPARVWEWASKERPVLHEDFSVGGRTWGDDQADYVVMVEVCVQNSNGTFLNGCTPYTAEEDSSARSLTTTVTKASNGTAWKQPNCTWNGCATVNRYKYTAATSTSSVTVPAGTTTYKPTGILHEYGANGTMLFGLMSGSYDKNLSGGRLRRNIANFGSEISADGTFASTAPIVDTFNNLRIMGFNDGNTDSAYSGGWVANRVMNPGEFPDWGNPIGEMLYEVNRYFAKEASTSSFTSGTTNDEKVGLTTETWADPYAVADENVAACSRANVLTISDINTSFDSNEVPGNYTGFKSNPSAFAGTLADLNSSSLLGTLTTYEFGSNVGNRFIGESGTNYDAAPSAKSVTSLASVRGLAPEEPTKEGSFTPAAMAYYAKTHDLRPATGSELAGDQTLDQFVVALSSPLPRITVNTSKGKTISFVPFAKSVGWPYWVQEWVNEPIWTRDCTRYWSNGSCRTWGNYYWKDNWVQKWVEKDNIDRTKGAYQPTNQIVDFYVETIANSGAADYNKDINDGRYYAEFQINFEDVEQGADHDMDAIARYKVWEDASGNVNIQVNPDYQAGGIKQNMGYVVSGAGSRDGVYLVAGDEENNPGYYLNVPAGQSAGYCSDVTKTGCGSLPYVNTADASIPTFTFTPSGTDSATYFKDPLYYAAKYGGFIDSNGNNRPDLQGEWDNDKDGIPDTYFLVQNPSKLADSLRKAFTSIVERNGSGSNLVANSTSLNSGTHLYQALYNSAHWSGDLMAYGVDASKKLKATPDWKASTQLELLGHENRKIYFTRFKNTGDGYVPEAVEFKATSMNSTELALFESDSSHVNYLRGDRTNQVDQSGTLRTRSATSLIGDITDSSPVYVDDTKTVYIGANDGMLHAFDAETGNEKFAFIPSPSLPNMNSLTQVAFKGAHKFFVDGEIAVTTRTQTTSKNLLVALMGRGGKGLFSLDVSAPASFGSTNVSWEYTEPWLAANSKTDADLGYMLGRPVIAKLQNGTIAAFVGNGYESESGHAVLYVFNVTTGAVIAKIDTVKAPATDSGNGLATPGVVLDADGKAITVYAGDLKGNLWKFDVSADDAATWTVGPTPFYVARDSDGNRQPITAPVTTTINSVYGDANQGKLFVYFGTGSLFRTSDRTDNSVQTLYGLIDETGKSSTKTIADRSTLVEREFVVTTTLSGSKVRSLEEGTMAELEGKNGFYIDLPEAGERVVTKPYYGVFVEPTLLFTSAIPSEDLCTPGGSGYLNGIHAFSGARLVNAFFDVDGDGEFSDDTVATEDGEDVNVSSIDLGVGMPSDPAVLGDQVFVNGSNGELGQIKINTGATVYRGRLTWREIVVE